MNYGKYQSIKVAKNEGIALLTLNRPDKLNAVDRRMHEELAYIFEDLTRDSDVKVVVLTGAGRAFCAGGDISNMEKRAVGDVGNFATDPTFYEAKKTINDLVDMNKPIIAAVNGPAIGLGATLALFCDIIIASKEAKIGDPHVKVGIVAGDGGAVIWPLIVGIHKAKELLMTGNILDANEAERIGLVNKVVPLNDLMPESMRLAKDLANGPVVAIGWTKLVLNKVIKERLNLLLDASLALEGHTFHSRDHQEAARAFIEKRKPQFRGE